MVAELCVLCVCVLCVRVWADRRKWLHVTGGWNEIKGQDDIMNVHISTNLVGVGFAETFQITVNEEMLLEIGINE